MKACSLEVIEESPEEYMDCGLYEESFVQDMVKRASSFDHVPLSDSQLISNASMQCDESSRLDEASHQENNEHAKATSGRRRQLVPRDSVSVLPL